MISHALALAGFVTILSLGHPAAFAQSESDRIERFDEASARLHAMALLPVLTDDVLDGQRGIIRALPTGGDIGVAYQFRLRPQPVRFRPYCELQTVILGYEFVARDPPGARPIQQFDLLGMKQAGALRHGNVTIRNSYLQLSPAPATEDDHARRCLTAATEQGWREAVNAYEFETEIRYVAQLREALRGNRHGLQLRCRRGAETGCPISGRLILHLLEGRRRHFSAIRTNDRSERAQFVFYDEPVAGQIGEMRSLIIERRSEEIVSVTLVYTPIVPAVI